MHFINHTSRLLSAMMMLQEFVTRLTLVEAGKPGPIVEALPEVGCKVNLGQSDFELRAVARPTASTVDDLIMRRLNYVSKLKFTKSEFLFMRHRRFENSSTFPNYVSSIHVASTQTRCYLPIPRRSHSCSK